MKGQIIIILGFTGHSVSVATTHFCQLETTPWTRPYLSDLTSLPRAGGGEWGWGGVCEDWGLYQWPGATRTNHHQLAGLRQENLLSHGSGGQGLRTSCLWGRAPSQGSQEGSLLPLPASGGARPSWACGRISPTSASVFFLLLLPVSNLPLPSCLKDHCHWIWGPLG